MSYYVYIMSSKSGVLYIGATNDLDRRVFEHKQGLVEGFTKKYSVKVLVYYEVHGDIHAAIHREKRLKKWKRQWKVDLIQKDNLEWGDLYESVVA